MSDLKTDYKDDVLDVSANVKRIFNLVDQDGKIVVANVSIQDITKYTQEGDSFGAADINATNEAVNGKLDGSSTVNPMLATEEGFAADAYQTKLQFEEQNKNMGGLRLGVDADGNCGYIKDGADTVTPFKKGYEDTPATATAADITVGKTAWVNGKLIPGTRPAAIKTLSGSVSQRASINGTTQVHVTFATPFDTVPTVSIALKSATNYKGESGASYITISSKDVTREGFVLNIKNSHTSNGYYMDCIVSWNAFA